MPESFCLFHKLRRFVATKIQVRGLKRQNSFAPAIYLKCEAVNVPSACHLQIFSFIFEEPAPVHCFGFCKLASIGHIDSTPRDLKIQILALLSFWVKVASPALPSF